MLYFRCYDFGFPNFKILNLELLSHREFYHPYKNNRGFGLARVCFPNKSNTQFVRINFESDFVKSWLSLFKVWLVLFEPPPRFAIFEFS